MHRHGLGKDSPGSLGFALWRWQVKLQTALGPFQGYFLVPSCRLLWASTQENVCFGISPYMGHRWDIENSRMNVVICAVTYNTGKVTT